MAARVLAMVAVIPLVFCSQVSTWSGLAIPNAVTVRAMIPVMV